MRDEAKSVPVFSTGQGTLCRVCGQPEARCRCRAAKAAAPGDGVVRVGRETKGRKGKGVTVVTGVPPAGDALAHLAGELKRLCGCGGTVRDGVIEVQGDHRERIVAELAGRGYRVKRSGG